MRQLVIVVCALGVLARLGLAWTTYGNFDAQSYEIVADIVRSGGNVYAETSRYNYGPPWAYLLAGLDLIAEQLRIPLIVVVRTFLTGVDVATAAVLVRIAGGTAAAIFLANPVSIVITGHHGQFDNLAILLLLLGMRTRALAIASVLIKPLTGPLLPFVATRRPLIFLLLGLVVFGASLLPFALDESARDGMARNIIGYSGAPGRYGLGAVFPPAITLTLMSLALLVVLRLIRSAGAVDRLLMGMLALLVFLPGFSEQWIVLPIALGAVKPTLGYAVFTAGATVFLLGSPNQLPVISEVSPQVVWAVAIVWFSEQLYRHVGRPKRRRRSVSLSAQMP